MKIIFLLIIIIIFIIAYNENNISMNFHVPSSQIWGIDLSHHQGNVDWSLLSEQKPHFVFLKATEGTSHIDTKYHSFKRNAKHHSIKTGSYHFFNFNKDGRVQAHFFCSIADVKQGELPPVLDVETSGNNVPSREKVTFEILEFIAAVESNTGVKPIIYCNRRFYNKYLKNYLEQDYPLWICDYNKKPNGNWLFWQKTDKHKLRGIKGNVDLNYFNGDKEMLRKIIIAG